MQLYAMKDLNRQKFGGPFVSEGHADAERFVAQTAEDPRSSVKLFPKMYELYFLGTFHEQEGALECPAPKKGHKKGDPVLPVSLGTCDLIISKFNRFKEVNNGSQA